MPRAAEHRDCTLRVGRHEVKVGCQHCPWSEIVSTAPPGVDLIRAARLAAFDHCWTQHQIHAWDVSFAVMSLWPSRPLA